MCVTYVYTLYIYIYYTRKVAVFSLLAKSAVPTTNMSQKGKDVPIITRVLAQNSSLHPTSVPKGAAPSHCWCNTPHIESLRMGLPSKKGHPSIGQVSRHPGLFCWKHQEPHVQSEQDAASSLRIASSNGSGSVQVVPPLSRQETPNSVCEVYSLEV